MSIKSCVYLKNKLCKIEKAILDDGFSGTTKGTTKIYLKGNKFMKIIYIYTEKNYSKDRSLINETRKKLVMEFINRFWPFK